MNEYNTTKNLRDRVVIENGIATIRPINKHTGKVMGTPQEQQAAQDAYQKALNERARNFEREHIRYIERNF